MSVVLNVAYNSVGALQMPGVPHVEGGDPSYLAAILSEASRLALSYSRSSKLCT
jgi:hypothetical protein